jgi:protease-4
MIVLRLLGLVLDLLMLPLSLLRRGRIVRPGAWLEVTIDGPVVDVAGKPRLWQLRAQKALSLHWLDEVVEAAAKDRNVKGLLVTIRSLSAGMASATSLRAVLGRARAAGKEVVVHLPMGGDTKEVYVATAASRVLLGPAAQLAPLGFRSAARYLRPALERAGIEPQVFACGEFKSAGETLVRDEMSPAQRAQLERLLDGFHDEVTAAIAAGRGVDLARARAIVDEAPYFGAAAVEAGLADGVAYEDELPAKLGLARGRRDLAPAGAYLARARRPLLRAVRRRPAVAVVSVHGTIAHASGAFGDVSTDERLTRTIRAVRQDRRVRGVILHIDSPGGSALASDRMHHEIEQLAREKPVVACMANVAASGGYYVAAPAACIVAQPTTVTGSIGVVAARISIDPLLARLGIRTEVVARGARSSLLSPTGPLDEGDRAAIHRELDATYRAFVGVVASGREMAREEVERLAGGRVYSGKDALAVGLVDVLGGFDVALRELEQRLDPGVRGGVEVVVAKPPRSPVRPLDPPDGAEPSRAARRLVGALLPEHERALVELAATGERTLLLAPVTRT